MHTDDDPGWPTSIRMLAFFVPGYQRRVPRQGQDGLILLRQVFMTFCLALAMFVVLALLYPSSPPPTDPPTGLVSGLLLLGAVGVLLTPRIERPLDCTNDSTLHIRIPRPVLPPRSRPRKRARPVRLRRLLPHVRMVAVPSGSCHRGVGIHRAAPTRGHLRRDQELLAESSCFRPLVRILRNTMPPAA